MVQGGGDTGVAGQPRDGDGQVTWRSGSSARPGYTKIAATIRKIKSDTALLLAILGLKNPS